MKDVFGLGEYKQAIGPTKEIKRYSTTGGHCDMGPLEDIGPYAETVITTRKTDVADSGTGIFDLIIGLCIVCIATIIIAFMGLFILAHIELIRIIGPIVIGFWACARYGTNKKLFKRRRKIRLSDDERQRINRRLGL